MRSNGYRRDVLSFATLVCLAAFVALFPTDEALAATPGEINFQGLLLDSGGMVVNGSVDLDFELFDTAAAGTSLWSESHTSVSVLDGVYDLSLGSITPIGAAVLAGGSVWLEITVEGETLAPRQRLLAVPYSLRSAEADHATSADTADTAGGLPLGVLEEIYANFSFDGGAPPNNDPSEGLADTDNDGLLNFVDRDNDNDGLSDSDEVAQGSDINLVTPTITSSLPSTASDFFSTPVAVTGTNFIAGMTVAVSAQTPTPTNITPTSFDIVVAAQPATSTSLTVTRPNGEQDSIGFVFELTVPAIASVTPSVASDILSTPVAVTGTNFLPGLTVQVGAQTPTAMNLTPTSFDIVVPPQSATATSLTVTNPNAVQDSSPFTFALTVPSITSLSPVAVTPNQAETINVVGTDFIGAYTVTFDGSPITPDNVTTTSFSIDIVAPGSFGTPPIVVTLPNGQSASEPLPVTNERIVFVTSTTYVGGAIGGLSGADALCAARATAGGLSGTFLAWLGDSTGSPSTRFTQSIFSYRLLGNTVVANDYTDLTDGSLQNGIDEDESGSNLTVDVWSNVTVAGVLSSATRSCTDWSSTAGLGRIGLGGQTGGTWTSESLKSCADAKHLYCFEQ